jgi:hypothetical protein
MFGKLSIRDGDPIVHQKFTDHLILLRVGDGVGVEVSLLEGFKIREMVGVIEEEKTPGEQWYQEKEDEHIDDIGSPPLSPSPI